MISGKTKGGGQPKQPKNQTQRTPNRLASDSDMSSLVKVQDKLTVPVAVFTDHNLELNSLWATDNTRDWEFYINN